MDDSGIKIGLVGEQGYSVLNCRVGKTHIISQYLKNKAPDNPASTIAVQFATTVYTLRDGTSVRVEVWDTAGHEKYKDIVCVHLKDADGIIMVYDVRNERSFLEILKWLEKVRKECKKGIKLMLLGNKIDLVEDYPANRKVSFQDAKRFSQSNELYFHQTSVHRQQALHAVIDEFLEGIMLSKCQQGLRRRLETVPHKDSYCNMCGLF